jgi:hypothetical protein
MSIITVVQGARIYIYRYTCTLHRFVTNISSPNTPLNFFLPVKSPFYIKTALL